MFWPTFLYWPKKKISFELQVKNQYIYLKVILYNFISYWEHPSDIWTFRFHFYEIYAMIANFNFFNTVKLKLKKEDTVM